MAFDVGIHANGVFLYMDGDSLIAALQRQGIWYQRNVKEP